VGRDHAALIGDDATYTRIENRRLAELTAKRDGVADRIKRMLDAATLEGVSASRREAESLLQRAERLIRRFDELAASS